MNRIVNRSIHSPRMIIFISLIATIVIISGMRWFTIDDDFFKMFPKDIESRVLWEDMTDEFGDSELLLISFGEKNKSIYNKNTLGTLKTLSEELEKIDIVDRVISLGTIDKIENDPEDPEWLVVNKLFPDVSITDNQIANAKKYIDANPDIKSRLISKNEDFTAIAVRSYVVDDDGAYRNNSILMNQVTPLVDKYLNEFEIHYAGNPYITGATPKLIRKDAATLILSGLIIMVLLLFVNIRNIKAVLLILLVIFSSIAAMNGFMGWLFYLTGNGVFNFTMISTSMPIVLLTIANSDGVHIITHFFKEFRESNDKIIAIKKTMDALILPLFLTSITTIVAFLAMVFSPIPLMIGYGICVSFGIFWAWLLSNTLLPALISKLNWSSDSMAVRREGYLERAISSFGKYIFNKPKRALITGISVVALGLFGILLLKVEVNIIKFFKPGNPIRESTEFVDNNFTGTMSLLMRVNSDMKDPETLHNISKIQNFIEGYGEVRMTISLSDLVKTMHQTLHNSEEYYTIPDSSNKISNLIFMAPKDQLENVVNTTTFETGMIHSYLISLSTEEIVIISDEINEFIALETPHELNIETSGLMIMLKDFIDLVISSSIISIAVSIIAIFIISFLFFGRLVWASLAIIPLCSAVILNFGLMGIFGVKLSHLTALLTSIIIGVGVDFAVHYISCFKRKLTNKKNHEQVSNLVVEDVGYPIALDVVSNMGFAALLFSDLIPLNYMGGLMIFAMLSTSFGTFILMGAAMEIVKKKLIK